MARRQTLIARSIIYAILNVNEDGSPAQKPSLLTRILRIFYLYWLSFQLVRQDLFSALRSVWEIKEDDYKSSFDMKQSDRRKAKPDLYPMATMGYSGSTFFRTLDSAYLVKSVPRQFEHDFFKNDLIGPYVDHMKVNRSSLLVHITNFLASTHTSVGVLLGLAPSHHIVMENILHGQDQESQAGPKHKWESWDLKPTSYFFPERDIAGGAFATEATMSRLADEFHDKIRLSRDMATQFQRQLENDTLLLAKYNAVDYSLFLVRISAQDTPYSDFQSPPQSGEPGQTGETGETGTEPTSPAQQPFAPADATSWRTGVASSDGKEMYRAAILDFFWAKHTARAKAMTGLIRSYNLIDDQGPMSITTDSNEYRERFLKMCMDIVEVEED
ncbi:SAICAR synthase-like protein [Hypoxylon fragiforme]|uniref:SAICAR synthase-like protein n=1 Tax=Hypoxylon fragiforme TaxID=63214 RepID=UPI0020C69F70|nr:SAICAR synthase-like protein [Hypoxylon fragiforme]KAI2603524.1 SAICAR synthase-like protein [Hypoxylon fragiforme]